MTTTRDLLDAQAFERRRLAAVLVTGGTDGRLPNAGRLATLGSVLALLLLTVSAAAARL